MSPSRSRNDDLLFIGALAAVLVGIGLLLETTGIAPEAARFWPLLVLAAGGLLLYLAIVRRFSDPFFFAGILFSLVGLLMIAGAFAGWTFARAWPLLMVAAGLSWLASGLRRFRRAKPQSAVPALIFVFLGSFFGLFSFGLVRVGFRQFMSEWWPTVLIAGGAALFVAYGASGPRRGRKGRPGRP